MESDPSFISLHRLSQVTGLPAAWLKAEANADRIPCLKVGRRLLFNLAVVERALFERSGIPTASQGWEDVHA